MAGQLCRGISGFNLMSTGYKPIYEVLSKFAAAFPTGQKTNAAVVGRLMNNIKLGYYPTDPDNISLMLRAIRFPDGVMYLNAYTKEENYQKYFDFLEKLRQSGETNMYGAAPYLQSKFSELHGSREKANAILIAWIKTFEMEEGDEPC